MKTFAAAALKSLAMSAAVAVLLCGSAAAQSSPASAPPAPNSPTTTAPAPPPPQGVVVQRNLSLSLAKTIAEATLAACQSKGFHTAAAVVDRAGQVLVILRDEQATAQQAELSRRKAYTARMYRMTTLDFQKRTLDPTYAPQTNLTDIIALGGGVPVQIGSETIGGAASSGSNQQQDDACAKAGIAKVADQLKP